MEFEISGLENFVEIVKEEENSFESELLQFINNGRSLEGLLKDANQKAVKARYHCNDVKDEFVKEKCLSDLKLNENQVTSKQSGFVTSGIEGLREEVNGLKETFRKQIDDYASSSRKNCLDHLAMNKLSRGEAVAENLKLMEKEMQPVAEEAMKNHQCLTEVHSEIEHVLDNSRPAHELAVPLEQRRLVMKMFDDENAARLEEMKKQLSKKKNVTDELNLLYPN